MVWLLLFPALYALGILAVAWLTARAPRRAPEPSDALPRIAVLVAARNEEGRLGRCLDALLAQDYPADRLDILVADDHSTDGTAAVIGRYHRRAAAVPAGLDGVPPFVGDDEEPPLPSVRRVVVPDAAGHLQGKANAIHAAVEACDHDLLLVTDADCAPPPGWARHLVAYFDDAAVGIVCGQTVVAAGADRLSRLQALDWAFLLATCSALVEVGRPVTAMGNNMGFRRAAYEAVGGYPGLPFSVTEDYVLFKTIVEQTPWRARFPSASDLHVVTLPLHDPVDVYQQRRRWARGGLRARAWVYGAYAVVHLAHLGPLVLLVAQPLLGLVGLAVKSGADFALLRTALGPKRRRLLRVFGLWQAYVHLYMTTLPAVLLLFPRINWKDRKL